MKRLLIITIFVVISSMVCMASQHLSEVGKKGDASTRFVRLGGGFGYGVYRDLGASPLTMKGLEIMPELVFLSEDSAWHYEVSLSAQGGAYGLRPGLSYVQAYGGAACFSVGAERLFYADNGWQLWAGAKVEEAFDIRYNSSLGNANVGVSNCVAPAFSCMTKWQAGRLALHGRLEVLPLGVMLRPGFAYMDNFDHDISNPVSDMFNQYRWYLAGAVGMSTDVGVSWNLPKGNRVGLSYLWHYRNSRTKGLWAPHCFEQASHCIVLELDFVL